MLALVPAAVITVALVSYGLIGIEIIVRALVQGTSAGRRWPATGRFRRPR